MRLLLFCCCLFMAGIHTLSAQPKDEKALIDSVNRSFTYQTGTITLHDGTAKLVVPKGFKYLDATQSRRVLTELWGN